MMDKMIINSECEMIKEFQGEYRWLSNFWQCEVPFDGEIYPSAEHAYQASKTVNDLDKEKIKNAATPGIAKRMGKKIITGSGWEKFKLDMMESIVRRKFMHNPELAHKLKKTGSRQLIEGNRWGDTFWGVCNGVGQNNLGKILMRVRRELIEKEEVVK